MNIGDYVRTNRGTIFKIENITEIDVDGQWFKSKVKPNSIIKDLPKFMYDETDEIVENSSPNIIDLIEVGDYVNGNRVIKNCIENKGNIVLFENGHCARNEEIKSIVTKEQFERNEYKI